MLTLLPSVRTAQELVAALRAFHYQAQTNPDKKAMAHYGLDLVEGKVRWQAPGLCAPLQAVPPLTRAVLLRVGTVLYLPILATLCWQNMERTDPLCCYSDGTGAGQCGSRSFGAGAQ